MGDEDALWKFSIRTLEIGCILTVGADGRRLTSTLARVEARQFHGIRVGDPVGSTHWQVVDGDQAVASRVKVIVQRFWFSYYVSLDFGSTAFIDPANYFAEAGVGYNLSVIAYAVVFNLDV